MEERQRALIKYDIDLVEAPLLDTEFMVKSNPIEVNQLKSDNPENSLSPPQYNHVININSG